MILLKQTQFDLNELLKAQNDLDVQLEEYPDSTAKTLILKARQEVRQQTDERLQKILKGICQILGCDVKAFLSFNPGFQLMEIPVLNHLLAALDTGILKATEKERLLSHSLVRSMHAPQGLSGLWDTVSSWMSSAPAAPANDAEVGENALKAWFKYALSYPDNFTMSYDELKNYVLAKSPAFFDGLGLAINSIGLSSDKVDSTMQMLADKGEGRLPENFSAFFNAIGKTGSDVSFWDAIKYTIKETSSQVVDNAYSTAQDISSSVSDIRSGVFSTASALKYLPWILGAGAALYIFTMAGGPMKLIKRKG